MKNWFAKGLSELEGASRSKPAELKSKGRESGDKEQEKIPFTYVTVQRTILCALEYIFLIWCCEEKQTGLGNAQLLCQSQQLWFNGTAKIIY